MWLTLFNRFLFAALLSNTIALIVVWAQGYDWRMLIALTPLPFMLATFKWYCSRKYNTLLLFHEGRSAEGQIEDIANDAVNETQSKNLTMRYCHPALMKPLSKPLIREDLKDVVKALLQDDRIKVDQQFIYDLLSTRQKPSEIPFGRGDTNRCGFELSIYPNPTHEHDLHTNDLNPQFIGDTYPSKSCSLNSADGFEENSRTFSFTMQSGDLNEDMTETTYPSGYHAMPSSADEHSRFQSHSSSLSFSSLQQGVSQKESLLRNAASMGRAGQTAISSGSAQLAEDNYVVLNK